MTHHWIHNAESSIDEYSAMYDVRGGVKQDVLALA